MMVTIDARNFKHIKEAFRFADVSNKGYLTSNGYKKAIIALFGEKPSKIDYGDVHKLQPLRRPQSRKKSEIFRANKSAPGSFRSTIEGRYIGLVAVKGGSNEKYELDVTEEKDFVFLRAPYPLQSTSCDQNTDPGEKEAIFGCDRNRKLTLKDFTDIILSREKESNREQQIHKAFFLFDLESKGFLVLEDFVKAQLNVFPHLSHRVLEKAFSAADVNNDGRISYREFHSIMSYGFPFFI